MHCSVGPVSPGTARRQADRLGDRPVRIRLFLVAMTRHAHGCVLLLWAATTAVPAALASDSRDLESSRTRSSSEACPTGTSSATPSHGWSRPEHGTGVGWFVSDGLRVTAGLLLVRGPVRQVRIPEFAISSYEVTFEQYDRFAAATGVDMLLDEGWGRAIGPQSGYLGRCQGLRALVV